MNEMVTGNGAERRLEIHIVGCACVITSMLTPEEILAYKHYHPEALTLVDEENGKPVFSYDIGEDTPGSITNEGCIYSMSTTGEGWATMTILIDPKADDKKKLVIEKFGRGIQRLQEIEEQLFDKKEKLKEEACEISRMIRVL